MPQAADVMTVDEARERFAGKWLALEVMRRDDNGMPESVRLIDKADTRDELCEKTGSFREFYITFAGPIVPKGWAFVFGPSGW